MGTSTDIDELRTLQKRQQLLLAELQHRVRNILAMTRSVARRTLETANDVNDYASHLEGRLSAMARTQAVLTRNLLEDGFGLGAGQIRPDFMNHYDFLAAGPVDAESGLCRPGE